MGSGSGTLKYGTKGFANRSSIDTSNITRDGKFDII